MVSPGQISLHRKVGWGFLYIRLDLLATTRKVLSLTPSKFSKATAMFHKWVPGFDPRCSVGLAIPVWISLRFLLLEFLEYTRILAKQVGRVIEEDSRTTVTQDPRFCVEVNVDHGWISTLLLPGRNGCSNKVIIDYDIDPLCYQHCFSFQHGSSHCDLLI